MNPKSPQITHSQRHFHLPRKDKKSTLKEFVFLVKALITQNILLLQTTDDI